ncbi:nucleoside diphosphate kinase B [Eurytemora carolleeae]|uniref:nucleoside diphosphate kinase B n=1 Tax=Eurytemora carolleeae TaxID=1294199 RepID=UPI000C76B672|nr:nucleoside diphosphate kinase B [Eurytemora carolleeae]|eukprot:XP_023336603.1 nucleoside diphosphate kinase B-like [Eurytemora affinis]
MMRFTAAGKVIAGVAGLTGSFIAGGIAKEFLTQKPAFSKHERSLVEVMGEKMRSPMQLNAAGDPNKERTFIMVKPDGVQRGLVGDIIQRFEKKGFKLVAIRMMAPGEKHMEAHYADLAARPFYPGLVKYMSSGPVVAMCWEGLGAVKTGRVMLGETNPKDSKPGTIRGDFCIEVGRNIIHGSDAVDSAEHEIGLWFREEDLCDWTPCTQSNVYGQN